MKILRCVHYRESEISVNGAGFMEGEENNGKQNLYRHKGRRKD